MLATERASVQRNVAIPTWFGVGGGADALVTVGSVEELSAVLREERVVRVLGEGANLLVDDSGVDGVVVSLARLDGVECAEGGLVRVGAGADLMKLITSTVRDGLAGLEALAGIPASIGGACVMNAGGAFGSFAEFVRRVRVVARDGSARWMTREEIGFDYRRSGLEGEIVVEVELGLREVEGKEQEEARARLKEVMAYKKGSQPMAERSAGCVWKNPMAPSDWTGMRTPDAHRVPAGWLVDQTGLKGVQIGGAMVSPRHANFVVTEQWEGKPACTAGDVLALMREVRTRVLDRHGIALEPEVVVWRRGEFDVLTGGRASL